MKDDRKIIDWETPDWTPGEMPADEPPFSMSGNRPRLTKKQQAESHVKASVIVGCFVIMVACVGLAQIIGALA